MNTLGTLLPETTGSEYRRFVFESSASYWLPINNTNTGHTTPNANTLQSNTQLYVSMTYNTDE